jgi:ATP-dependent DNA helicase DinG
MMMDSGAPLQFHITPEETLILNMYREVRHIYTDGRPLAPEADRWVTTWGESIGHWEGDTLVIETVGVRYPPDFFQLAPPLSEKARYMERIRRTGPDTMEAEVTIEDPETLIEPSPFDWNTQALCYLPPRMPEPASRDYGRAVVDALTPVLEASNGRAFVLFASHRALREAAEALRSAPWPLFVQGEAPRHVLLQRFRESGNGVLLGAASFREGVDVAGDALSVVVIDKLPFAAPDDPVFEARLDAIRRSGGNPFRDEQLPQAVIALKQGVGRLIRSETDRGVLVLCDPRLVGKSYGRVFFDSLPPFARTREVADVEAFFAAESRDTTPIEEHSHG